MICRLRVHGKEGGEGREGRRYEGRNGRAQLSRSSSSFPLQTLTAEKTSKLMALVEGRIYRSVTRVNSLHCLSADFFLLDEQMNHERTTFVTTSPPSLLLQPILLDSADPPPIWQKQLHRKQPFSDNYVDESFLAVLEEAGALSSSFASSFSFVARAHVRLLPSSLLVSYSNLSTSTTSLASHHLLPRHLSTSIIDLPLHRRFRGSPSRRAGSLSCHLRIARRRIRWVSALQFSHWSSKE